MGIYDVTVRRKSRATKSGYRQETFTVMAASVTDAKKKALRDSRAAGARELKVTRVKVRFGF